MLAKRILIKTALTPFTGYGNDGLALALGFTKMGWDVALSPTIVQPPLPGPVAALLTRPVDPPYDVLLHHADPEALGLTPGERRSAHLTVAWTMWEFQSIGPQAWADTLSQRLGTYDLALTYDEVSEGALGPFLPSGTTSQRLQGGYWADDWSGAKPWARDWSGTFQFAMVGALHARKNPFATIRAFNRVKEEYGDLFDAELHLKTNSPGLHPQIEESYPGVFIHYANWPRKQLQEFYLRSHCLVAPSWGEGKNLPALEAMTTGLPVIATKFGGHKEWMGSDWSYEAPHTLSAHIGDMYSARVDEDALAALMWHVYTNRDEARRKGELAANLIPSMCDWSKVLTKFSDIIASTTPGRSSGHGDDGHGDGVPVSSGPPALVHEVPDREPSETDRREPDGVFLSLLQEERQA